MFVSAAAADALTAIPPVGVDVCSRKRPPSNEAITLSSEELAHGRAETLRWMKSRGLQPPPPCSSYRPRITGVKKQSSTLVQ